MIGRTSTFGPNKNEKDMRPTLLSLFILLIFTGVNAQSKSRETSRTSSSNGVSSESSITRSDDSYKFDARFNADKYEEIEDLLVKQLGTNYQTTGSAFEWKEEVNGKSYFKCRLTATTLRFSLDRELSSLDFYSEIDELGDDLKGIIQKHAPCEPVPPTPPTPPNPNGSDPQEELRKAEMELLRAQERLDRLKKKGNR